MYVSSKRANEAKGESPEIKNAPSQTPRTKASKT
jgi:hypothetical protein